MKHVRSISKQPVKASANLAIILDFLLFTIQTIPTFLFQKQSGI